MESLLKVCECEGLRDLQIHLKVRERAVSGLLSNMAPATIFWLSENSSSVTYLITISCQV